MVSFGSLPGIRVGHWTNLEAGTGCTVVLCAEGMQAGVDVRGAAPATRETDLLRPSSLVGRANAILLTGGSAFGLDAATGVMRFLEERGLGYASAKGPVPIVPAAALFDLALGRSDIRPDAEAGYAACVAAGPVVVEGTVGAGTGATVAKLGGPDGAIKGGIGSAAVELPDGTLVAAILAVNAVGSIYDAETGEAVALPRVPARIPYRQVAMTNTTIGVVATTAPLDAAAVHRFATISHDGLALAIRPAHTQYDGDALFALSVPVADARPVEPLLLHQAAVEVVARSVVRAVRAATSLHGVPAAQ
jgi:L-aminopeptidase/D-esterase-like protein